ncbi:MAG TPA: hypothetical protein VKI41_06410, partial [Vicinamibacteria bacterium]|nr:hypothetical protein [Vicinamibacteria bacterium]
TPFLQPAFRIDTTVGPTFGQPIGYAETPDGTGAVPATAFAYGIPADGSTPIGNSLRDIKTVFSVLWGTGAQPPAPLGPVVIPPSGAIQTHVNPKENTVVVFVTDGDDTCSGSGDPAALAAAGQAQNLYQPIVGAVQTPSGLLTGSPLEIASSVNTYVVGYGTGAQVNRLNWVAWGGSGMQQGAGGGAAWPAAPTAGTRAQCVTCHDAFLAPTPAALGAILDGLFSQGAQKGEFTAQQSLTDAIFEFVDQAPTPAAVPPAAAPAPFSAFAPYNRFDADTPIKFVSSFTLPGFNGQLKAYQNILGAPVLKWSAGDKLTNSVTNGMNGANCPTAANPGAVLGECSFVQLHGGATDSTIATSSAAIKRRVYTTSQNGYFGVTIGSLLSNVAPYRVPLWPPTSLNVAPANYTTQGLLDGALGLPLDSSASPATDFASLQTKYKACLGSSLPAGCISGAPLTQMQAARREAREIVLAYMAGAAPSVDSSANPKRVALTSAILYHAKAWVMGEATLATAAVVGPPLESTPDATPWVAEYNFYIQGPRTGSGANAEQSPTVPGTPPAGGSIPSQTSQGFGLTRPDRDNPPAPANDGRTIKPVMTVVYAGGNDMLHAFRAGPNIASLSCTYTGVTPNNVPPAAPTECGGEELWGFVPFDSLAVLSNRYVDQPPKRSPHDYMIAASVRFNDIFVPSASPISVTIGGVTTSLNGVWRKVIYFGRGISGKYFTALDVTAPGTLLQQALVTNGPIPLWNRGNPDTTDGTTGGTQVNGGSDYNAYLGMGQTWSTPAVVFVDKTANITARKLTGVDFVMYVGSGYGASGEGTTFYALDALTGDVIKSADVNLALAPATLPVDQNGNSYANAIVTDP